MWKRHFLFLCLCLSGLGALGANLLRTDRVTTPRDFWAERLQDEGLRTTVEEVNQDFRDAWSKAGIQSAPRAPTLATIRRLSLGLMGTVPSLEELRALEEVPEAHQIEWWLSRIFADRRYSDYVGERLARAYVGTEDGPFLLFRRRRFVAWLSDRLHNDDMGYAEMVRHILADEGLWTDKPSVNFVTVTIDQNSDSKPPDPIRLAARTTRAFLGLRIDCLQCHDDKLSKVTLGTPENAREGKQSDFHQLAAYFGAVQNRALAGIRDDEKKQRDSYKVRLLGSEHEQVLMPRVPYRDDLVDDNGSLRQQLATWVTHRDNRPFARTAVNRFWALLFGTPLVRPIDEIPLFDPLPPALETLASDLIEHDFDMRRLIRIIAASDVFQVDSRAEFAVEPVHEAEWAAFPLIRLRPEQVAGSVLQAASLSTIDANANIIWQLIRYGQENDFVQRYGDMGEDEFIDRGGTIPQRLLMMNGNLVKERTEQNLVMNASTRVAFFSPNDRTAVESAYLSVLTRRPTELELQHFLGQFGESRGPQQKMRAVEDLYWTLFNCTEFLWNH